MKLRYKLLPLITVVPIASFFGVTSCKDKDIEHEVKHVQNFSQLKHTIENQARQGQYNSKTIVIDQDIVCNETIYVMNDTTIVCNENHSIIRGVNFLDDMFVVGEDENGINPILSGDKAILTLKTNSSSATLTIDGNKNGVTGDIHGSAIFVSNHSDVNFNDNVIIKDCKKDKNVRTLTKKISKPITAGGAAVLIAAGSFNMFGGLIDNCICPADDGSEDKAYMGGAVYANGPFNMSGGTISNCSAARGGALYTYTRSCLVSGTITKCSATKYGGFAYCPDNQYSNLILGAAGTSTNKLNIIENSCGASGGAIYGGHKSVIYSLGNCIFDGNIAANNGGAINSTGSILLDNTTLKNNKGQSSTSKGGAIYAYTSSAEMAVRETQLTNCVFESNSTTSSGGAITFDSGSDEYSGAIGKITDCSFNKNTSGKGGAVCAQAKSNVSILGSTFSQNETTGNGAAIYNTNSNVTLAKGQTTNLLSNNTAQDCGGSIAVHSNGLIIIEQAEFNGNTATTNGGGLYLYGGSCNITAETNNDVIFTSNKATGGAGIYMASTSKNQAVLNATHINLNKNTASKNGGGIYVYTNAVANIKDLILKENKTGTNYYGGGMYLSGASNTTLDNVEATSNSATSGGFVYITTENTQLIIKGGTALNNTASSGSTLWANTAKVIVKIKGKTSKQYFNFNGAISGKSGFEVQDYEE